MDSKGHVVSADDLLRTETLHGIRSIMELSPEFMTAEQDADLRRRDEDEQQLRAVALESLASTIERTSYCDTGSTEAFEVN